MSEMHQDQTNDKHNEPMMHDKALSADLNRVLTDTIPKAETAFQTNLEEQLMTRLTNKQSEHHTENETMRLFSQKQKRNSSRLPLTLAAAVLAISIVGGLFFFLQTINNSDGQEASTSELNDAEPSASIIVESGNVNDEQIPDLMPMVIATQQIEMGVTITEDMLTVIYVSSEFMADLQPPESSFMNVLSSVDLAIGQATTALIEAYEPVLMENIREPLACDMLDSECSVLPDDTVAIALAIYDDVVLDMPIGMHVDVLASVYISDVDDNGLYASSNLLSGSRGFYASPAFVTQRVYADAILIDVIESQDEFGYHLVTLAIDSRYATMLTNIAEATIPTYIVPHVEGTEDMDSRQSIQRGFQLTGDGLAIISIPLKQTGSSEFININDVMDITFSLPYQFDNTPFDTDFRPEDGDVFTYDNPNTTLQIANSTLLYVGRGDESYWNPNSDDPDELFMAITVNLTDAWLVQWYVDNNAQFWLEVDAVATNQAATDAGFAVAFPVSTIESVQYAIVAGDIVDLHAFDATNLDEIATIDNIPVLYIGENPDNANIRQDLIYWDAENPDGSYIVVHLTLEQHHQLFEVAQNDVTFTITLRHDMTPPFVSVNVLDYGDAENERIQIFNGDSGALSIDGWSLEDENGNRHVFGERLLFQNAGLLLYTGAGQDSPLTTYWGLGSPILEVGETLSLYDDDGELQAVYTIPSD